MLNFTFTPGILGNSPTLEEISVLLRCSPTFNKPRSLAVVLPRSDRRPSGTTWKVEDVLCALHPGTVMSASSIHSTTIGDDVPYACRPFDLSLSTILSFVSPAMNSCFKRIQSLPPITFASAPESTRNWIGLDVPNRQSTSTSSKESVLMCYNKGNAFRKRKSNTK